MFLLIDPAQVQRLVSIVRDDRNSRRKGDEFLRVAAVGEKLTLAGQDVSATIPATIWEEGVLFIRPAVLRRMLGMFKGEDQFAIQVTRDELLMGNVTVEYDPEQVRLFPEPTMAPDSWPPKSEKPAGNPADSGQKMLFLPEPRQSSEGGARTP